MHYITAQNCSPLQMWEWRAKYVGIKEILSGNCMPGDIIKSTYDVAEFCSS